MKLVFPYTLTFYLKKKKTRRGGTFGSSCMSDKGEYLPRVEKLTNEEIVTTPL